MVERSSMIRERFEAMVRGLERNPRVTLVDVGFPKPASAPQIEYAKGQAGGALPGGMEEFYRSMNGFRLEWEQRAPEPGRKDEPGRGMIDILPLYRVLGDWEGTVWYRDMEGGEKYRPVRPLDFFVEEACAALVQPDGQPLRDEVVYHYLGESIEHTGHSFREWMDKLLAARGYFYWIRTLCAGSQASPEVLSFRKAMPLIFEDYDDALFQPKAR